MLFCLILYENSNEVMHTFVLIFMFVLVDIQLFAEKTVPVLFELSLSGFSYHFTLYLDTVPVILLEKPIQFLIAPREDAGRGHYGLVLQTDSRITKCFHSTRHLIGKSNRIKSGWGPWLVYSGGSHFLNFLLSLLLVQHRKL